MDAPQQIEDTKPEAQNPSAEVTMLNPLAELVSHFEDDPDWDVMMESIRRHRREMDAAWDSVE